jgi:hypothetical protein
MVKWKLENNKGRPLIMNIRSMTDVEKRTAAKAFVETWLGRGDEKQDAQNFWRTFLTAILSYTGKINTK